MEGGGAREFDDSDVLRLLLLVPRPVVGTRSNDDEGRVGGEEFRIFHQRELGAHYARYSTCVRYTMSDCVRLCVCMCACARV